MVNDVNDAAPAVAANEVCPPRVHAELTRMVSVFDTRLPYWSSTFTVKGRAVCAWVVPAGSVVKASLLAVVGVTVTVAEAVPPVGVSVAVTAHDPVLAPPRMTPENVAFPEVPPVV
jgi:hypothetical protein